LWTIALGCHQREQKKEEKKVGEAEIWTAYVPLETYVGFGLAIEH
jgi:hypothetical protein